MQNTYSHFSNGFLSMRIETTASKFFEVLNDLTNYDDGQGRNYDILDSEIYE